MGIKSAAVNIILSSIILEAPEVKLVSLFCINFVRDGDLKDNHGPYEEIFLLIIHG